MHSEKVKNTELTDKELLTVRYIYGGYCDKETARFLNISHRTVQTHRLTARKKWNLKTKRDLFVACRERGVQAI